MKPILEQLRRYLCRTHVRPWALSAPILILLICLPLLRPLRHPDPHAVSETELGRLATVQALVEQRTLVIDNTDFAHTTRKIRVGERDYSDQPAVMALLLAGPYWIMYRLGLNFAENPILVPYLLTMLGVTLPVAAAAGLIYKMGRLFELPRPWRAGLALAVVLGSGLVSYAVVLNSHAPAAVLVLAASACLVQVAASKAPQHTGGWLMTAGLCAALAAVIELPAAIFAVLLLLVIAAMPWGLSLRTGGVLLYLIGCTPAIVLHAVLTVPVTGDLRPGVLHPQLVEQGVMPVVASIAEAKETEPFAVDDDPPVAGFIRGWVIARVDSMLSLLFGAHGLLSHFPVILFGLMGTGLVMHRHWPATTKMLAGITIAAALLLMLWRTRIPAEWQEPMFAARWLVIVLPLMLFWAGAWLRRRHRPAAWALAGLLLAFSMTVSLIGATDPFPRGGFNRYTAADALQRLIEPPPPPQILAGG